MISWALKRSTDSARDAPVSDDTTQIDLPDTPAPVFAVRALKTALFGTPAPRERRAVSKPTNEKRQQNANASQPPDKSPARPPGILLTPGTGTTRRKRVSFNHDVKQGSGGPARGSSTGLPDECPGKFPSPWADRLQDDERPRLKTKLQEAMESSRKGATTESRADERDPAYRANEQEDAWEEVGSESELEADVTTDLNEPHSRSGKYWKSYFETYHSDAKAEMEKLVKYKHLAKSYAKMKDAEALELNQKLREEQEKVRAMEQKLTELSRQVALTARRRGGESDPVLVDELNKQTALATEYKAQVEELEALLQDDLDGAGDGRQRQMRTASPRTQRTLMEAQRELRRARSQVRELDKLQEERDRLRSDLKLAEQRAGKLAEENSKLSGEMSQSRARIQELEKRLEDCKGSYEKLKDDAKARYLEAQQVLKRKNDKIAELLEEIESLKRCGAESKRFSRSERAKSLDEKCLMPNLLDSVPAPPKELGDPRPISSREDPAAPTAAAEARRTRTRRRDEPEGPSFDDATLAQSRALREKLEAEFGTKGLPAFSALSDRGNLQDSRSSASSGRSAHSREDQAHSNRTDRPSRSNRASTTSAEKIPLGEPAVEKRPARASLLQTRSLARQQPKGNSALPEIENVPQSGDRARAAAADAQSSVMWSVGNTSRTAMPEHRRAAALARLQRRKAERAMQQRQLEPDKENTGP